MADPPVPTVDLLAPADFFRRNYVHQIRQTINAYSASKLVVGEALQNAIDAVCESQADDGAEILVDIDFDQEAVTVADNGIGFPPDTSFLYLGGTNKHSGRTKGKIGVGIKVTMFSSAYFGIRSNTGARAWKTEVTDAHKFEELPSLPIPNTPEEDLHPLAGRGTQVQCRFPADSGDSYLNSLVEEIVDACLPGGVSGSFGTTISENETAFPSPFAALFSCFLRRYTYVGDVLAALNMQERFPSEGIQVKVVLTCSNPHERFGDEIGGFFGPETVQSFTVQPNYLHVEDTLRWVPRGRRAPRVFHDALGHGGKSLRKTDGINRLTFSSEAEYEALLVNVSGNLPPQVDEFRESLFGQIRAIELTIGRIPELARFLPGGSRRVISCNGVITDHDIDLTSGTNQQYVRCIDFVIDVDSDLNYGKTQLTNMHLVKRIRDYVNVAYTRVLQNATAEWVGKLPQPSDTADQDIFVGREDLNLPNLVTRKVPRDENDVIALFFEMAGQGVFPADSFRIYGLSQKDRYDCRAAIRREEESEEVLAPVDDGRLRVVDFKVRAADVMRDFQRRQKFPNELDLVIAWTVGERETEDYAIYNIDQSNAFDASPSRVFPYVSKYIYDSRDANEIQILLLEEVVNELRKEVG